MNHRPRRVPARARLPLCAASLVCLLPASAFAGPHDLAPAEERPETWDMSLEELREVGLGQSRGNPVPVPTDAARLRAPDQPPLQQQQGVIFVNFDGAQLTQGSDDAPSNRTQLGQLAGAYPSYGDGDKRVAVMQAVMTDWADYNVVVTDSRPASGQYTMNMTGPKNVFGQGVLGIAPLDCFDSQTHSNITYAFHSANDMFSAAITATTIGQEVAHSYGLEHVDEPNDIMNPYNAGGDPTFIDSCIQVVQGGTCAQQHQAVCGSGFQQNAHQELLALFGPGIPDTSAPAVVISAPMDGQEFPVGASFDIEVMAVDEDTGIEQVQLFNNGVGLEVDTDEPYGWGVSNAPAGDYELYVEARDLAGNVAQSQIITVHVGVSADGDDDDDDSGDDDDDDDGDESGGDESGDAGADGGDGGGGCGCRTDGSGPGAAFGLLVLLGLIRRRR